MGKDNALTLLASPESVVARLNTPEDVAKFLANLKTVEQLLKAAKRFHDEACRYAMLEAAAYARIVDLGLIDSVPSQGYQRQIVEWFGSLGETSRKAIVDECGKGGETIRSIWNRTIHKPRMEKREVERMEECGEFALEEFRERGEVQLDRYFERMDEVASKYVTDDVRDAYKDKIRGRIRDAGGHGLNDGKGTYLSKENAADHVCYIVANKVSSMVNDVRRLLSFADDAGLQLSLRTRTNFTPELDEESAINAALLILGLGEPCLCAEQPGSIIRIYSTILKRLGITPYELFSKMVFHSVQYRDDVGELCGIDLRDFGWPDGEAEKAEKILHAYYGGGLYLDPVVREAMANGDTETLDRHAADCVERIVSSWREVSA